MYSKTITFLSNVADLWVGAQGPWREKPLWHAQYYCTANNERAGDSRQIVTTTKTTTVNTEFASGNVDIKVSNMRNLHQVLLENGFF
jgi:hypothetical protein